MALTNAQLWNYLRDMYPTFASQTAKATADLFTAKGFDQLASVNSNVLNDFFGLSLRVFLQKITVADVKDVLAEQDFGESYDMPYAGYAQRIAINSIKPISPAYKGLDDGDAPDPFIVRKPETSERFYDMNFDYQSLITIPDRSLFKNMWVQEFGMSEYIAGIMKGLNNGYVLQKATVKLDCINEILNSATYPLKATQQYQTSISNPVTAAEIIAFIELVRDVVDSMVYAPATSAFNTLGFESTQNKDDLRLLIKPQLANQLATISRLNSPEDMALPIKVVKVPNFGGLTPTLTASETYAAGLVKVTDNAASYSDYAAASVTEYTATVAASLTGMTSTPIYDNLGVRVATAYHLTDIASVNSTDYDTIYVPIENTRYTDPNADTLAVIADKGIMFENIQNPYTVEPIRNPRGLYTNYWASSPNNGIKVDRIYNVAEIIKAS